MQKSIKLSALTVVGLSLLATASASQAAVNGTDDRQETYLDARMHKIARATLLQVPTVYANQNDKKQWTVDFVELSDSSYYNVCKDEKFASQKLSPIACTGFLIAPDLMMTAGHCMVNFGKAEKIQTAHCESFAWLLDYQASAQGQPATEGLPEDKIVRCKEVIYANFAYSNKDGINTYSQDIALVRLERPITDRPHLKLAMSEPAIAEKLAMVGYPHGVPAKYVKNSAVLNTDHPDYIRTNIDAVGGNSGSPVLNAKDEVVGLLVRSFPNADLVDDKKQGCARWNRCSSDMMSCMENDKDYLHGTEVQRASAILPFLPAGI